MWKSKKNLSSLNLKRQVELYHYDAKLKFQGCLHTSF